MYKRQGHKIGDVDSFGAAVGIYRIARTLERRAQIVLNDVTTSLRPMVDLLSLIHIWPTSAGAGWTSRQKPVISGQPQKALHPLASLYGSNSQTAQGSGRAVGNRQSAQGSGRTVNGTVQPRVTGDMHAYTASGVLSFGELPDTAKLRAAGHAKIDHSIRWVQRLSLIPI